MMARAALLLASETRGRHLKVAGFLLTLALLVRFQYAPFVAVLVDDVRDAMRGGA